jgi:hypothetical protein
VQSASLAGRGRQIVQRRTLIKVLHDVFTAILIARPAASGAANLDPLDQ